MSSLCVSCRDQWRFMASTLVFYWWQLSILHTCAFWNTLLHYVLMLLCSEKEMADQCPDCALPLPLSSVVHKFGVDRDGQINSRSLTFIKHKCLVNIYLLELFYICWLIYWMTDWLTDSLISWLIDWLIWLVGWLTARLIDWLNRSELWSWYPVINIVQCIQKIDLWCVGDL
jgi:hypothetical protein